MKRDLPTAILAALLALGIAAQLAPFRGIPDPAGHTWGPPATPPPAAMHGWWTDQDAARAEAFDRPAMPARLAALLTIIAGLALAYRGLRPEKDRRQPAAGPRGLPAVIGMLALLELGVFLLDKPFLWALYRHALAFGMTALTPGALLGIWLMRLASALFLFIAQGVIIYCLLDIFPRRWWLAAPLALFLLFNALPELIPFAARDPVEELTPLPAGAYRDAVGRILQRDGAAMPIMVSDASRRDNAVNACLGGRAAARYAVFTDTFIARFTPAEAAMAIAHELGHYRHELFFMALRKTSALAQLLAVFGLAYAWRRRAGGAARIPSMRCLVLIILAGRVMALAWMPLDNAIARWDERLADRHALELCGDHAAFAGFLAKGALFNLEPLRPAGRLARMLSDHPDILERWNAAQAAPGGGASL